MLMRGPGVPANVTSKVTIMMLLTTMTMMMTMVKMMMMMFMMLMMIMMMIFFRPGYGAPRDTVQKENLMKMLHYPADTVKHVRTDDSDVDDKTNNS